MSPTELSQVRTKLAEMQQERDESHAENARLRTVLAQMHDRQVDLREKAYIIGQKYDAAKVRGGRAYGARGCPSEILSLLQPIPAPRCRTARCYGTFCQQACPSFAPSRRPVAALPSRVKARRASATLRSTKSLIRAASARFVKPLSSFRLSLFSSLSR